MTRVLHIARYRLAMLDRKLTLVARSGEFDVSLLRPTPRRPLPGAEGAGAGIRQMIHVPLLGTNPHTAVYAALALSLPRLQPDLIHAEEEPDSIGAFQVALARRLFAPRARLIFHTWQNVNRQKGWHVWRVIRSNLRQADGVACASAEAIALLRTFGFHGPAAEVPQYGVDLNVFRPGGVREPSEVLSVLYAGRLIVEKGLDTLIDAVAIVNVPLQLTIVGDGPCRASLEAHACASGVADRVEFVARVLPDDLARRMARSDVLVLPSRTTPVWKEQFGRVLVEAMACAVPIVGSRSGAIADVIGDGGLVFDEGDALGLAACLSRLAMSVRLRRELGARGHARVLERYSQERIAERTADFYRQILSSSAQFS